MLALSYWECSRGISYFHDDRETIHMSNVDVIKGLYHAFGAKDYDAFSRMCDPELEWIQNPGFPNGTRHEGAEAVIEKVFKSFNKTWEDWRFVIEEYLDTGNTVVVIGYYEGVHRVTHKSFRSSATHVYDLKGGKLRRFRQFTDTKVIWDAMS
jgi:uncharacterized protein